MNDCKEGKERIHSQYRAESKPVMRYCVCFELFSVSSGGLSSWNRTSTGSTDRSETKTNTSRCSSDIHLNLCVLFVRFPG